MIEAELPDGRVLEFPDDTNPAVIQGAVKKMLGQGGGAPPPGYGGASVDRSDPGVLWDVIGDTKKDAVGSFEALKADAAKAIPSLSGDIKPTGSTLSGMARDVQEFPGRLKAAASIPLDLLGIPGALVRGPAKALFGSALSYLPGMTKAKGDDAVANAMMGIKPGKTPAKVPTAAELKVAAKEGYDAVKASGVEVKSDSIKGVADTLKAELESDGINARVAPKTFDILGESGIPPAGSFAKFSDIETLRKSLGHVANSAIVTNPTERLAAKRFQKALDRYQENIPAGDLLAGTTAEADLAAQNVRNARGNIAAGKRTELVDKTIDQAELRAAASNSGQNSANTIRQRLVSVLGNEKKIQGFSPEERAQMRRIVEGTTPGNLARYGGNVLGAGGGLGQLLASAFGMGAGGVVGGPVGAAVGAAALPTAGRALRGLSNLSTKNQIKILEDLIAMRSPLGKERQASAASVQTSPAAGAGYALANGQPDELSALLTLMSLYKEARQ